MKCTEMEHNGPIEILVNFQIYIFNNGWRSPFICKTLETYQQITKHYLQQLFSRGKKKNQFSSERTNSIKNEFKNHVLCKHRELWFCNTGSRLLIAQPMQLFGAVSCLVLDTLLSPGDWYKPVHRKFMALFRRQEKNEIYLTS